VAQVYQVYGGDSRGRELYGRELVKERARGGICRRTDHHLVLWRDSDESGGPANKRAEHAPLGAGVDLVRNTRLHRESVVVLQTKIIGEARRTKYLNLPIL